MPRCAMRLRNFVLCAIFSLGLTGCLAPVHVHLYEKYECVAEERKDGDSIKDVLDKNVNEVLNEFSDKQQDN